MDFFETDIDIAVVQKNKQLFMDEIFYLVYYTSMTYHDVFSMPISKRKYLLNKLSEQKTKEQTK